VTAARCPSIAPPGTAKGEALPVREVGRDIPADVEMKVLALYGKGCARCGQKLDRQLHHIVFYSRGGPNEVWNLIAVCVACHGCIHHGTLEVFRDSPGELHWRTKAERVASVLEDEVLDLASVPPVVVEREGQRQGEGEGARNGEKPSGRVWATVLTEGWLRITRPRVAQHNPHIGGSVWGCS